MSDLNEKNNKLVDEILKEIQLAGKASKNGEEKSISDVDYILNEIGFQSDEEELWNDPYLTPEKDDENGRAVQGEKRDVYKAEKNEKGSSLFGGDNIFASIFGRHDGRTEVQEEKNGESENEKNANQPDNTTTAEPKVYKPSFDADEVKINFDEADFKGDYVKLDEDISKEPEEEATVDFMSMLQNNDLKVSSFKPDSSEKSVYETIMTRRKENSGADFAEAADYFAKYTQKQPQEPSPENAKTDLSEELSDEEKYMRGMAADNIFEGLNEANGTLDGTAEDNVAQKPSYSFKTFGGYSAEELLNDNQNVSAYSKAYDTDFSSVEGLNEAKTEKTDNMPVNDDENKPEKKPLNIFEAAAEKNAAEKRSDIYGIYLHDEEPEEPEPQQDEIFEEEEYSRYAEFGRLKTETDNFKNAPAEGFEKLFEEKEPEEKAEETEKSVLWEAEADGHNENTENIADNAEDNSDYYGGFSFGAYSSNGVFSDSQPDNTHQSGVKIFDYENSSFDDSQKSEDEEKLFYADKNDAEDILRRQTDNLDYIIKNESFFDGDEADKAEKSQGDTREFEPPLKEKATREDTPDSPKQTAEKNTNEEFMPFVNGVYTGAVSGFGSDESPKKPKTETVKERPQFDFDDIIAYEPDYTPILQSDVKEAFRDAAPLIEPEKTEQKKNSDINEEDFVLPIDIKASGGTPNAEKFRSFADFKLTSGIERSEFEKFFSTGVMLEDEESEKRRSTKRKRSKRKAEDTVTTDFIISREEITGKDADEPPYDPPRTDDYNTQGDAESVMKNIKKLHAWYIARTLLLLVLGAAVAYIWLAPDNIFEMYFMSFAATSVLLLIGMLLCMDVIARGIGGLFSKPTADTLPAVASAAAMLQAIVYMFNSDSFYSTPVTVFAPAALLCLIFSSFGRVVSMGVVLRNFKQTIAEIDYSAAYLIKDKELNRRMAEHLAEPEPQLLVSRPTALVKGFLRSSFSERISDRRAKGIGIAVTAVAVICAAVCFIITKNIPMAVTAFAAAACLGAPITGTIVSAVPSFLMQRSASKVGAIITGWSSIEELGRANIVTASAEDLFPEGHVKLCGIKTFAKERVDLAILYAASILAEGCGTMQNVFMPVIEGNVSMLYKVENLTRETGCGIMGWIDHNRVVLGNRAMMMKHGVELPSMDYELRYTKGDKKPMYLAVSGRLFGMFLLKYTFNEQVAEMLDNLQNRGISLLVQSDDFNLSAEMIEEIYDLQSGTVKVMSAKEEEALKPSLSYMPDTDGNMAHIGTFASFLGGLKAASSAASAEKTANAVQICGAVIGMLLVILLTVTGGIASLNLPAVLLYMTAWALLTAAMPLLRRY